MSSLNDLKSKLDNAINLREEGLLERSCSDMRILAREYPDNAEVNFQTAWSHDKAGLEGEAVPFYEQALKCPGLTPGQRQESMLGLGSSYHLIGRTEEAVLILEQAVIEFPEFAALRVFKAVAYHAAGRYDQATGILLDLLADTSADKTIIDYCRPIREYAREYLSSPAPAPATA